MSCALPAHRGARAWARSHCPQADNFPVPATALLATGLACVLLLLATSALAAQGTTRLLGRVVGLNGDPVDDVRLRVVGHGEPEVFASGEFQIELSGQPAEVEIEVVGDELEVLYPLRGALAVPRNGSVRVPVVVGKSERAYINDVLAARFVQLESTLNRNGVRYDATVDSLGEGVRQIIQLLQIEREDLVNSIERQKQQADVKPLLLTTFDAYVLEVKDLRDAFRMVVPFAARDRGAVMTLQQAILEYNEAYEAIETGRNRFMSGIRDYWEPQQAELLGRDLGDVYTEIMAEIHRAYVLPLNSSLVVLQRAHGRDAPSNREVDAAVAAAQDAAQRMEARIGVLETRYARLREALERR
jgi:hypothetical protein